MCMSCWETAGRPDEMTERTTEFLKLVDVLYVDHSTGGPLHAELDDWNVDGTFTTEYLDMHATEENFAALTYLVERICDLANRMTPNQRRAALAIRDGFLALETAPQS
jgi:hypothetical protein